MPAETSITITIAGHLRGRLPFGGLAGVKVAGHMAVYERFIIKNRS
jgi:hypothetical protein